MQNETERCCKLQDPLAGQSLFPSTLSLPSFDDFHNIDNHLRSIALRNPTKLVEQAKSMLEDNLCFHTENSTSTQDVENEDGFPAEEDEELPQKRRPGLGLNRARPRFSLKPTKKPSVEDLLPILDMKKLNDPEEFFAAHEQVANARREIEKQMGIVSSQSNKPRERRPGLPGFNRRPVRYKHRVSTEALDNNDDVLSSQEAFGSDIVDPVGDSQEAFGSDIVDPVGDNTDKGEASLASLYYEVNGSSATEINDILQGLLTCDSEELEGDGAINLLQEKLQVKPIFMEKLSVPDFPDIQPVDLKSLRENLPKPRKALSNIDNLLKGMNIKTPLRQDAGYAEKQLGSPTPPRSPLASLSSLQKYISRSNPSSDPFPFSADEFDHIPTRNYSSTNMINQEDNILSPSKPSDELSPPIIKDVIAASEINTILETTDNSKADNSRESSVKVNASIVEDIVAVSETSLSDDPDRNCPSTPQKSMIDNSMEPGFNAAGETNTILETTENSKEDNSRKSLDKVNAPINEDIVAVSERSLSDDPDRNCTSTPQKSMIDNSMEPGFNAAGETNTILETTENSKEDNSRKSLDKVNAPINEDIVAVSERSLSDDPDRNCTSTHQKSMVDNSREPGFNANVDSNELHVDMDVDIGDSDIGQSMDDMVGSQNVEPNEPHQFEDKMLAENMQESTSSVPTNDANFDSVVPLADQSNPVANQANSMDKRSRRSDDGPEQCLQEKRDGSVAPANRQKRVKSCAQKEPNGKRLRQRKSLADAGTSWESGVRRSTRFRTKPLEYWKGERMVYGRVHESLSTVIGVKRMSPGTDGKPKMKTKSFVSDEYKELFEIASQY
ncbi:centromere protein C-like [Trifolium pratense]|uniref:centromere protein C-like n=1 Tax=Trifolium pratense TaxID=57577 RepID=UPI001E69472C|nr:centromere protein C-like [Trifolium pratense]